MKAFVALVFALFPLLEVRATEEPGAWEETLLETTVKSLAIYKAYVSGLCKGISQQNMAKNMVQYLHFRILEFPLINGRRRPSLQGIRYDRYGSKLVNQQIWMILKEEPTQCVRRWRICEAKYLNPGKIANW